MITALEVNNFRCFKTLRLNDCGKFNIVVGNNAGGKTALLESIYLPGGGPEQVFKYFNWRGLPFPGGQWTRSRYEDLWTDLFYQFDSKERISISLTGTAENNRRFKLYFDDTTPTSSFDGPSIPGLTPPLPSSSIIPVVFETIDNEGNVFTQKPFINAKGEYEPNGSGAPGLVSFIPSFAAANPLESAEIFSTLSKRNETDQLKKTLREVFPDVLDVSIEILPGGITSLYCSRPNVKEKVPLGLVSAGVSKLVQILLGIAGVRGGVVVVDEIENGFHYKAMPKVWEAIIHFCEEYKVQLFASTHSKECLDALEPMLRKKQLEFRLLRAEEDKQHEHTVRVFSGREFDAALETGTEFR